MYILAFPENKVAEWDPMEKGEFTLFRYLLLYSRRLLLNLMSRLVVIRDPKHASLLPARLPFGMPNFHPPRYPTNVFVTINETLSTNKGVFLHQATVGGSTAGNTSTVSTPTMLTLAKIPTAENESTITLAAPAWGQIDASRLAGHAPHGSCQILTAHISPRLISVSGDSARRLSGLDFWWVFSLLRTYIVRNVVH